MTDSPSKRENTLPGSHLIHAIICPDNNDNSPSFSCSARHTGETHLTQGRRHLSPNIHENLHDAYADALTFI